MTGGPHALTRKPHNHVVNFYDDDDDVIAEVTNYVAEGLRQGEAAVIVATRAHRNALDAGLFRHGIDSSRARESEQYHCLDAADTLSAFMVNGEPERGRFTSVVGGFIARAAKGERPVRAFGEMVALLWEAGNVSGAIELESLWNELAQDHQFSLYCAYPISSLFEDGDLIAASRVCDHHTGVVAPLSYTSSAARPVQVDDAGSRSQVFVPVPSAVPAARRFVADTLLAWNERHLVDHASLVVSELATNAVRHASSAFRASICRDDSVIRIAVHDVSSMRPEQADPAPEALGGRGVAIVDRLSVRWGTDLLADGKVVWSELARSAG